MKRKRWLFCIPLLLAIGVSLCFYGVRIRLLPRAMLSKGLLKTFSVLDERYQNSPGHLLEGVLNAQGPYTAQIQLETDLPRLGITRYDMTLHTQLSPNRILAEGTVFAGGKNLDLTLYLDEQFAAIASRELMEGRFYGITYDTFSQDLRSRGILMLLLKEQTLQNWESSVAAIEKTMSTKLTIPDITSEDIRNILTGILSLKPQVGHAEVPLDGKNVKVSTLQFRIAGSDLSKLNLEYSDPLSRFLQTSASCLDICFSLYQGQVIQLELTAQSAEQEYTIVINNGHDTLHITITSKERTELHRQKISIQTSCSEGIYEELIQLTTVRNGVQSQSNIHYFWDLSTQELTIGFHSGQKNASIRAHLTGDSRQITLISQDVHEIMNLFLKNPLETPAICTLTIAPGTAPDVPDYRSLSEWSMEDLLSLAEGFGNLLGISLP